MKRKELTRKEYKHKLLVYMPAVTEINRDSL